MNLPATAGKAQAKFLKRKYERLTPETERWA
jgi:hypothetical protein